MASAQMVGEVSTPSANAPQWQVTIDGIKSKAKILMEKNGNLVSERQALLNDEDNVKLQIRDLNIKNEELKRFLKERHGKTDQHIQIEDLNRQMATQQIELARHQKELIDIQKQVEGMDHVITLKKLRFSDVELKQRQESLKAKEEKVIKEQTSLSVSDQELADLQKKWQDQKDVEADLQKQLDQLKAAQNQPATPAVSEEEIKNLRSKVQELALQKESLQIKNNVDNNQSNDSRYKSLIQKKRELEERIREYDNQLGQMKNPANYGIMTDREKKQTVHQMVEIDSRNNKLRQRITDLKDDVGLLKEQVGKLERKVSATKAASNIRK